MCIFKRNKVKPYNTVHISTKTTYYLKMREWKENLMLFYYPVPRQINKLLSKSDATLIPSQYAKWKVYNKALI